ncbi:hypothetical protein V8E54_000031 [Elaphomyces granulatus]
MASVSSASFPSYFSTPSTASSYQSLHTFPSRRPPTKKMSITQTYYLAQTARNKLAQEASRADHHLRLLVGHANLLDSLVVELANAERVEREQETWFNQTVSSVSNAPSDEPRHIQWAETIVEQPEEEYESDSDSEESDDSDCDDADLPVRVPPVVRRAPSPVAIITEQETYDDSDSGLEEDDAEDFERLTLTRSPSRQSPPELLQDSDDDSEEDLMPPSPPQPSFNLFSGKEQVNSSDMIYPKSPSLSDSEHSSLFEQGYYVSARDSGPMIQAF